MLPLSDLPGEITDVLDSDMAMDEGCLKLLAILSNRFDLKRRKHKQNLIGRMAGKVSIF